MRQRVSRSLRCLSLVAIFSFLGCGKAPPAGNVVSGTVTFKGQPIDQGSIQFEPAAGKGSMSGAPISGGVYKLPETAGLEPGKYMVRISSVTGGAATSDEPPGEPTMTAKELIPSQYNTRTTLSAEVIDGKENKFDYELK